MKPQNPILIVDDSKEVLSVTADLLEEAGLANVLTCHDSRKVLSIISDRQISVLVLDLLMPYVSGEDLLERVSISHPDIPVIVLTGSEDIHTAIRCMKAGAFDYVIKQLDINRLASSVNHALKLRELEQENTNLKEKMLSHNLQYPEAFAEIITQDNAMLSICLYAETIASTSQPVLITGETGTGKDLFANAVHKLSGRRGEMVTVNVAGFDDNMFSDTLFGHTRGAFTGAEQARVGVAEQAHRSTLFLDEIGDISIPSQVKLLRFIQDGEYMPLGSGICRKTDTRIIAATNRDINSLRDDFIFRLKTHELNIPPLRERKGDIPILLKHFVKKASQMLNKNIPKIPAELGSVLHAYSFPGNVRELESVVFDAVSREKTGILPTDLIKFSGKTQDMKTDTAELLACLKDLPTIKEITERLIDEAMKRSLGNQSVASRTLGITQPALSTRLKKRKKASDIWN